MNGRLRCEKCGRGGWEWWRGRARRIRLLQCLGRDELPAARACGAILCVACMVEHLMLGSCAPSHEKRSLTVG
jgi:hypothetical protein